MDPRLNGNSLVAPIVGAPFTLQTWFPTVCVTCGCEARSVVLIVGTGIGTCTACGRKFAVNRIEFDRQMGARLEVGVVAPDIVSG